MTHHIYLDELDGLEVRIVVDTSDEERAVVTIRDPGVPTSTLRAPATKFDGRWVLTFGETRPQVASASSLERQNRPE